MIVISDASPLIVLAKLHRVNLLNLLSPQVIISAQVRDEIVTRGHARAGANEVAEACWITVRALQDSSSLVEAAAEFRLGLGEMSTILLGKELNADLLLIDEWKARRVSAAFNLPVVGCVGLLERLYLSGHIDDFRSALVDLARFSYLDVELLNARLVALGFEPL